ncbi:MAG: hypothetical protein JRH16_16035 [Deltaproteobacteria bacterium]|nr:hypothetical protein [Deltaproteobacteria bacterium]MBW2361975.1 hypothetical protein [Deltaproteobacteria bacterium]
MLAKELLWLIEVGAGDLDLQAPGHVLASATPGGQVRVRRPTPGSLR